MTSPANNLTDKLRSYNTPDRTIDEQRQIAVDIHEAANLIERLQSENAALRARLELVEAANSDTGRILAERNQLEKDARMLFSKLESEREQRIAATVQADGYRRDADTLARCVDEQRKKIKDAQSALLEVFDQVPIDIVWMLKNKEKRARWMVAAGQSEPPCCDSKPAPADGAGRSQ